MMEKIRIHEKQLAVLAVVLFAASILPLLVLGYYNHPCADDFSFSWATRQVWLQTHSVWKAIGQAFSTAIDRYRTWQGTYTSIFFMALQPAVWGEHFYRITPVIMLSAILFSVFYLCRSIIVRCLKGTGSESVIVSVLVLTAMIQCIPDGTDSLFWYNGSVHYIIPTTAAFVLFGAVISMLCQPERRRKRRLALSMICAFVVGGGNYVTGLAAVVCAAFFLLLLFFTKKWKQNKAVLFPLLLCPVFFLINAAAPGNSVRSAAIGGLQMNPVKAIFVSFRYALLYSVEEWLDWTILVLLLLSVPFLWKIVKNSSFSFPFPILAAASSYCLFSSAFTPGLFAAGNIDAPRIQNAIFLLFIVLIYIDTGYLLGWTCRRLEQKKEPEGERFHLSSNQLLCTAAAFAMLLFGAGVTVIPNPDYYTSTAAGTVLLSGEAKAYGDEMELRRSLLNGPDQNIVLQPLKNKPKLLFFSDITEDANDWTNRAISRYYGKQSVVLQEESK